jgi:hypothetical protein
MTFLGTYYRGHDLLTEPPVGNPVRDQSETMPQVVSDGGVGQWSVAWPANTPSLDFPFSIVLETRDRVSDWLLWLSYRRGQYAPFWMPTWRRDFRLAVSAGAADTDLIVRDTGYTDSGFASEARRHVAVIVAGGGAITIYPRRIEASVDNGDGTETLTLDAALGVDIDRAAVLSFLVLARLADDTAVLHWHHPQLAVAEVRVVEVARQAEEVAA